MPAASSRNLALEGGQRGPQQALRAARPGRQAHDLHGPSFDECRQEAHALGLPVFLTMTQAADVLGFRGVNRRQSALRFFERRGTDLLSRDSGWMVRAVDLIFELRRKGR